MDWNCIQSLIIRTSELWNSPIEVANFDGTIVACSNLDRKGTSRKEIAQLEADDHIITIDTTNYLPLFLENEPVGWLCWKGDKKLIESALLKIAIEETIAMDKTRMERYSKTKEEEILIRGLLDSQAALNEKKLAMAAMELGYDLSLPRAIIVVYLEPKENAYFNINLQLGYDIVREQMKEDVQKQIRNNIHITTQDFISFYNDSILIIGKAFLNTEELHLIYQALDVICANIFEQIKDNRIFSSQLSYGSIASEISGIRKSYLEAINIMSISEYYGKNGGFVKGDEILMESLVNELPGRFIGRHLEPLYQKLVNSGDAFVQIMDTVETYIDNNMNIKLTSEKLYMHRNTVAKHIEKVESITGVKLDKGFNNIFIIKMLLVYFRRKSMNQEGKQNVY